MELTKNEYEKLGAAGFSPTDHNLSPFAEARFDQNSPEELIGCMTDTPDETDMEEWDISEDEWRECQKFALERAMFCFEEDQ